MSIKPTASKKKTKLSAHHRGGATESMEDYLECIAGIIHDQGYARVADVAEKLDVRRASVSIMIKRLGDQGFLNYARYRGFTLTPSGQELADKISERHEAVRELLSLLGLSGRILHRDVEGIEHHVSKETLRLMRKFIQFWKSHPEVAEAYAQFRL